jgi:ribosome-associated translation inhibitor RaiA
MNVTLTSKDLELSAETREYVERRLYFNLGRFLGSIDRVEVVLSDENGPRGGIDKRCRIAVKLGGSADVVVDGKSDTLKDLINTSSDRVGRAVARSLDRRRWKARAQRRSVRRAAGEG